MLPAGLIGYSTHPREIGLVTECHRVNSDILSCCSPCRDHSSGPMLCRPSVISTIVFRANGLALGSVNTRIPLSIPDEMFVRSATG